jgi:transcriptional regulator with XRE-family HTH domain
MKRDEERSRLTTIREERMWTQGRLAKEAGVSPTTVSGIETRRIVRPRFGTLLRLARALDVDPHMLLSSSEEPSGSEGPAFLSLQWARSAEEGEFERELEEASLDRLKSLAREQAAAIHKASDPRSVRQVRVDQNFYDVPLRKGR